MTESVIWGHVRDNSAAREVVSGQITSHQITHKSLIHCSSYKSLDGWRGWGENDVERMENPENRKVEPLAVGKACEAVF